MAHLRQPVLLKALAVLAVVWTLVFACWRFASHLKPSADKVRAALNSTDLATLTGSPREQAIQKMADHINGLSYEDRQRLREDGSLYQWFGQLTEDEKSRFIDATLPSGFKQMISAFEKLPEAQRQRAINDAIKHLRESNDRPAAGQIALGQSTNTHPPVISDDLQAQVRTLGLKTLYTQTSAGTKADLAPLLEEIQHSMQAGGALRGGM